jgi:hypothetical protein
MFGCIEAHLKDTRITSDQQAKSLTDLARASSITVDIVYYKKTSNLIQNSLEKVEIASHELIKRISQVNVAKSKS